jgi:hypothetical protein
MHSSHVLLRCSLVGLALIFSGTAGAANLACTSSHEGYRCEVWPQGANYRYEWHVASGVAIAGDTSDSAQRRIRCPSGHASAIAVSIIAPAGYVETATRLLPACTDMHGAASASTALASSL